MSIGLRNHCKWQMCATGGTIPYKLYLKAIAYQIVWLKNSDPAIHIESWEINVIPTESWDPHLSNSHNSGPVGFSNCHFSAIAIWFAFHSPLPFTQSPERESVVWRMDEMFRIIAASLFKYKNVELEIECHGQYTCVFRMQHFIILTRAPSIRLLANWRPLASLAGL